MGKVYKTTMQARKAADDEDRQNLKEIRDISSRSFFKGPLSIDSVREFDARYKKGWADKFEKGKLNIDKYLNSLG